MFFMQNGMVLKKSTLTNSISQKVRIHLEHIEYLNSNILLTLFPRFSKLDKAFLSRIL